MTRRSWLFALLIVLASPGQAALGRLFYTPEQRSALEQARAQNRSTTAATPAAPARALTYDGIVLRSDGRSTRWIDGKAKDGGSYTLQAGGRLLKPGQTLSGNRVLEAHGIRRPLQETTP